MPADPRPPPPHPCSQRGAATREFPRVAPRPGRAGGRSVGGGEQPGHQNRSRLWAGAALAGTLRRASSKDGQRVRRRPRPRSPLARGPAPRPGAAAGGRCPAAPPPGASRKGAGGAGRGRTRPRRLPSPPAAEARRQWPRGRWAGSSAGPPAVPSPHLCGVPEQRDAGTRPGWLRAAPSSRVPAPGPGRGGLQAGTRARGPGSGRAEAPAAAAGEGARGWRGVEGPWRGRGPAAFFSLLSQAERYRVSLFRDFFFFNSISILPFLAARWDLQGRWS